MDSPTLSKKLYYNMSVGGQSMSLCKIFIKIGQTVAEIWRFNSHAAILWAKLSETPPSCRQNSQDIMSVLYDIHYNVTPGDREAVT